MVLGKILFGAKYSSKFSYISPSPSDSIKGGEGQGRGVNASSSTFLGKRGDRTTCLYVCLSWELDRNVESSLGKINWPTIRKFSRMNSVSVTRKVAFHFMQVNGF